MTGFAFFDFLVSSLIITGQTYSRKVDLNILSALGGLGASVHKVLRHAQPVLCVDVCEQTVRYVF